MRFLILLLFSFQVFAMSIQDINNLTVNDVSPELVKRILLVPIQALPEGERWFITRDPLVLHASLTMPSDPEIEAELVLYKAELTAIENARLAELARVQDIKDRWNALVDIRLSIVECGRSELNTGILLRNIIVNNRQAILSALEACDIIVAAALAQESSDNAQNRTQRTNITTKLRDNTATNLERNRVLLQLLKKVYRD